MKQSGYSLWIWSLHAKLNEDFPSTFLEIWMKLDLDNLDLRI